MAHFKSKDGDTMEQDQIIRQLLQSAITKEVREKLTLIGENFSYFKKDSGADETDLKEAKSIVLEMIKNSCQDFYTDASMSIGSEIK